MCEDFYDTLSAGNFPDRTDEEADIREAVLNERDAVERTDETEQGVDD